MNEDLEFIKSVIKVEIKTWSGYRREIVDDVGEKEFIEEMSLETLEFVDNTQDVYFEYINGVRQISKEMILNYLIDLNFNF